MINNIFLLSHQDDEIAIFKTLKDLAKKNEPIYIFFLTNGDISKINNPKLIIQRENESKKILLKLGIKEDNIFFIGKLLLTKSYSLINNLNSTYRFISNFINNLNGNIHIYTHAWEGGNLDHDSCFIITIKLINNYNKIIIAYQFPFYNSFNMPLKFYRIFFPIPNNGNPTNLKISFFEKVEFIKYLFSYVSQIKIWIGLYPFVILKIILNKYNFLQKIDKKFFLAKPHSKLLWYEKRNFAKYDDISIKFSIFLK